MATLAALRKQAKEAGISAKLIKSADTAAELQSVIDDHAQHENGNSRAAKKKVVKKAIAAKKAKAKSKSRTPARKAAAKPAAKASGRKSAPAKSRGTAKRQTTTRSNGYEPKGGRNLLGRINYSHTDGWNPREGSAVDTIFRALKKCRGDREKAFGILVKNIGDFVKPKNAKGEKLSKSERETKLRYRIARTDWDFAFQTGQHEPAENRVEYGTGGTGTGAWKPAKKAKTTTRKATTKTPARKQTRKATAKSTSTKKTTNKRTANKRSSKR